MKSLCSFTLKKSTLSNIYYQWRAHTKIFSLVSIFDKIYTLDNKNILKDEANSLCFDLTKKEYFWHRHVIWMSPLFIKVMQ